MADYFYPNGTATVSANVTGTLANYACVVISKAEYEGLKKENAEYKAHIEALKQDGEDLRRLQSSMWADCERLQKENADLKKEVDWLRPVSAVNSKAYQQTMLELRDVCDQLDFVLDQLAEIEGACSGHVATIVNLRYELEHYSPVSKRLAAAEKLALNLNSELGAAKQHVLHLECELAKAQATIPRNLSGSKAETELAHALNECRDRNGGPSLHTKCEQYLNNELDKAEARLRQIEAVITQAD